MNLPKNHQTVMPYLMLSDAAAFGAFAKKVFDAELLNEHPKADNSGLMHAEISIGGSTIMYCDGSSEWPAAPSQLFVYVANADETYARALAAGGSSVMELSDQSYGRTCGVKDPTGNTWWITSL